MSGEVNWMDESGQFKVGHVSIEERPGRVWEVHLDVIQPMDRRQGHGSAMIRFAEQVAYCQGAVAVQTFMAADNEAAKGFFTKHGFLLLAVPCLYGNGRNGYMGIKPLRTP